MALVSPTRLRSGLEFSVHEVPRTHSAEVAATLPGIDLKGLLIIPTAQRSRQDLVRVGESIEQEKDELLEKFMLFAKSVCTTLTADGFWADYLDPCSGLTMIHQTNGSVYSEVDSFSTLLRYKTVNAGCCKVLLHPEWGSYVYPASLFAKAPLQKVLLAIDAAGKDARDVVKI